MATKESWVTRRANGNDVPWNKGKTFPERSGSKNPQNTQVEVMCEQCQLPFRVRNYRRDSARFCSYSCAHLSRDEGKRTADKRIRQSAEYKRWRTAVFERDGFTCVECGDGNHRGRGQTVVLHADHIKPFALYPELRFDVDNGRTLCLPCHVQTGTYGRGALYRQKALSA